MADEDKNKLRDFDKRLGETLSARSAPKGSDTQESSAAGLAFRAVFDLLIGLVVCMVAGYYLDKWFGTAPWIMLALMPIGLAAGVLNVMRLGNSKQAKDLIGGEGQVPQDVKDDDED